MKKLIFAFCLFSSFLNAQESDVIREYYNNLAQAYNNLSADDMLRNYSDKAAVFRSNRNNFIQIFSSNDDILKYFDGEFSALKKEQKRLTCAVKINDIRRIDNHIYVSGFQNLEISTDMGIINNDAGAFSHVWMLDNNEWKMQADSVIPVSADEFQKGIEK